jgi:hypothetical protein
MDIIISIIETGLYGLLVGASVSFVLFLTLTMPFLIPLLICETADILLTIPTKIKNSLTANY